MFIELSIHCYPFSTQCFLLIETFCAQMCYKFTFVFAASQTGVILKNLDYVMNGKEPVKEVSSNIAVEVICISPGNFYHRPDHHVLRAKPSLHLFTK